MRLCVGFTFCDNAADIFYRGEALCGGCANRKYGASVGLLAAIQLQEVRAHGSLPARPKGAASTVPVLEGASVSGALGASEPPHPSLGFADMLGDGWTLNDVEFLTELYERGER